MPPVARATPPTDRSARAIAIIPMLLNHLFLYLVAAVRGRRPATPLIAVRGMRASLEGEELAIDDARNGPGTSHRRPAGVQPGSRHDGATPVSASRSAVYRCAATWCGTLRGTARASWSATSASPPRLGPRPWT